MKKISILFGLLFIITLFVSCSAENKKNDFIDSDQMQRDSSAIPDENIDNDDFDSSQKDSSASPGGGINKEEDDSEQKEEDSSDPFDENVKENVSDLPSHLYQTTEMRSALSLRYDFEITEPTNFELDVSTISGKLSIGIKDRKTGTYILELTECTKEEYHQAVSLKEAGQYSLVLKASNHTGSYEVFGTPIAKKTDFVFIPVLNQLSS